MDIPAGAPLTRREARERRDSASIQRKPQRPPARAPKASKRRSRGISKALSFGALLASGALIVAVSVPATAITGGSASVALAASLKADDRPAQTMAVDDTAAVAAPSRDSFGTMTFAEQLRLQYSDYGGSSSVTTGAIRWPFPNQVTITDGFGQRSAGSYGQSFHNGTDFTPGAGTPIYAIAAGVVTLHETQYGGFGNHVFIQHSIPGQNVESVYAHMQDGSSPLVVGESIDVGDFIGLVGNTGNSYGSHLHLEIHIDEVPIDPYAWLQANAVN